MKKIKFLSLLLGGVAAFGLTACGTTPNNGLKPSSNATNSKKAGTGDDWNDIDENNCVPIIKAKTGINLGVLEPFTALTAYGNSYTKVAEVLANYGAGATKVDMFEKFIKELLRVGNNSIWSTDVDLNTYKVVKVDEYTTYESFYAWEIKGNEDLSLSLSGSAYIENYRIGYTFNDSQFNVSIAYYVIK